MKRVLITGGGGYVGSLLVPTLLKAGYTVTVLDLFWFWDNPFPSLHTSRNLELITGDIRNKQTLQNAFTGKDIVIHLACISNDPSFEMNPKLGKEINLDAFPLILETLKEKKVKQFIYASSSSVYGVQDIENVTEDIPCKPLTDYSRFKLICEGMLRSSDIKNLCWTIVRPATVCGYAPRMRLDLSVNVLTINAMKLKKMMVFGGNQLRPNLNISDMVSAYKTLLNADFNKINKETFNVGYENKSILQIAKMVKKVLNEDIEIVIKPTKDLRSYHINSDKINNKIGFYAESTIEQAIKSIDIAYKYMQMKDPINNPYYYNIKRMKELNLNI